MDTACAPPQAASEAEPSSTTSTPGAPSAGVGSGGTAPSFPPLDVAGLHAALDAVVSAGVDDGGAALAGALGAVCRLRAALDGAMVAISAGFEASGEWAADGHRTPAAWLVANHGIASIAARSERRVCLAASRMPHVSAAAGSGLVCAAKLRLLVDTRREPVIDAFDRDEPVLVAAAVRLSVDALRRHLQAWYWDALAALGRNHPDRDPGGTDHNTVTLSNGFAGRGTLDGDLSPEGHQTIAAAITAEIERWRHDGTLAADDPRTWNELQGDALIALVARGAAHPNHTSVRPLIIAVADLDTLLRRAHPDHHERTRRRAEILGAGPVSDATIAELAGRAGIALLITHQGQPLWLGRTRRLATTAQRTATLATHPHGCYWPGCTAPTHRCQIDHLTGWQQHGTTDIDNLAPICGWHNRLKHQHGYQTTRAPDGTITITRPDGTPIANPYQQEAA